MRRLSLLVWTVVLVDTMFYAAITPLLPDYVDQHALSKTGAGVLTASYAAGTLVGSIPGGWLAARVGVKPTLLLGLGLLGSTSLVFAFANSIVLLDVARFLQGIGGACSWAAGMAWLVAVSERERRGEVIGSALAAAIVGVLLGPVLGGAATVTSPELVFSLVSAAAAGLIGWAWVTPGVEPEPSAGPGVVTRALRRPAVVIGFWLFTLPALFAGVLNVLVPLELDDLGASGIAVGAVFLVAAGIEAIISPVAGRLSDRHGRIVPIRVGLAGAVVAAVLAPLAPTAVLLAVVTIGAVGSLGVFWAPAMAMLSDASEEAGLDQGLAFALSNLAWSVGQLVGGGAGGALADLTADALPYALLALACALTLAAATRRPPVRATV